MSCEWKWVRLVEDFDGDVLGVARLGPPVAWLMVAGEGRDGTTYLYKTAVHYSARVGRRGEIEDVKRHIPSAQVIVSPRSPRERIPPRAS